MDKSQDFIIGSSSSWKKGLGMLIIEDISNQGLGNLLHKLMMMIQVSSQLLLDC